MGEGLQKSLWCLGAGLALALCLFFLPLTAAGKGIALLLAIGVAVTALVRVGKAARQVQQYGFIASLADLPEAHYPQPIVLVCGDVLTPLFGTQAIRTTAQACYLRVTEPSALFQSVQSVLMSRPGWAGQISALCIVAPEQHTDEATLSVLLYEFRYQLARVSQLVGLPVASLVCGYLQGQNSPWFEMQAANPQPRVWGDAVSDLALTTWIAQEDPIQYQRHFQYAILLQAWVEWFHTQVQTAWTTPSHPSAPCHPLAVSLMFGALQPQPDNLWQRYLAARTGIAGETPASTSVNPVALPFPEAMLRVLPRQRGFTPRRRAVAYGLGLMTLFVMSTLAASAWHNAHLQQQIAREIARYDAVEADRYQEKRTRLEGLRHRIRQLDEWYQQGAPARLGMGLYQGEQLREPLVAAIKRYVAPPRIASIAAAQPTLTPAAVNLAQLDSMALFAVGESRLKPEAATALNKILVEIKAKPGGLILIAGHTDATGHLESNQRLSLARAVAVRDWMSAKGGLPASCFAVQGYGATRPIATNTTAAGRNANRRVEISLVPDAAACQPLASVSGSSTVSPEQATLHNR